MSHFLSASFHVSLLVLPVLLLCGCATEPTPPPAPPPEPLPAPAKVVRVDDIPSDAAPSFSLPPCAACRFSSPCPLMLLSILHQIGMQRTRYQRLAPGNQVAAPPGAGDDVCSTAPPVGGPCPCGKTFSKRRRMVACRCGEITLAPVRSVT